MRREIGDARGPAHLCQKQSCGVTALRRYGVTALRRYGVTALRRNITRAVYLCLWARLLVT